MVVGMIGNHTAGNAQFIPSSVTCSLCNLEEVFKLSKTKFQMKHQCSGLLCKKCFARCLEH